jgi:predicted metal-dependent hydrolase
VRDVSERRPPAWHTTVRRQPIPTHPDVEVEIRSSTRRRKTAAAYWQGDHIIVVLPARLRGADRTEMIESLVSKVLSHRPHATTSDESLCERADILSDSYLGGVRATSVRWVTNMTRRWASCTPSTGEIRVSERLRPVPDWVLDAVLIHELAHLIEPGHTDRFHELSHRHPRMADADIFLDGYHLGLDRCEALGSDLLPGGGQQGRFF